MRQMDPRLITRVPIITTTIRIIIITIITIATTTITTIILPTVEEGMAIFRITTITEPTTVIRMATIITTTTGIITEGKKENECLKNANNLRGRRAVKECLKRLVERVCFLLTIFRRFFRKGGYNNSHNNHHHNNHHGHHQYNNHHHHQQQHQRFQCSVQHHQQESIGPAGQLTDPSVIQIPASSTVMDQNGGPGFPPPVPPSTPCGPDSSASSVKSETNSACSEQEEQQQQKMTVTAPSRCKQVLSSVNEPLTPAPASFPDYEVVCKEMMAVSKLFFRLFCML